MQAKYLNFYLKFSDKFHLKYFTTIRSVETIAEKSIVVDDIIDILEEHNFLFQAKVVQIHTINLDELSDSDLSILMLDTGENWKFARECVQEICKSNIVSVVTLCKLI